VAFLKAQSASLWNQNSITSMFSRLLAGQQSNCGYISGREKRFFPSPKHSASKPMGAKNALPKVKQPGCAVEPLCQCAEIENEWS
jgi:hypothetical protein